MALRYGEILKAARLKAKKSMAEVARAAELSEGHLRDVEKGTRGPLGVDATKRVAHALGCSARPLLQAHVRERGRIELEAPAEGPRFDLAVCLLERWDLVRDDEVKRLVLALGVLRRQPSRVPPC